MGQEHSLPLYDPNIPFFSLFFKRPDKIRIVLADKETNDIIRTACLHSWRRGFKKEEYHDSAYYLTLYGNPFGKLSSLEEAVLAKSMASKILIDLYAAGWDFILSSDLTRYQDLSTWFFQRVTTNQRPRPSIICLSLSSTDRLHLIGADGTMISVLKETIRNSYDRGIQDERTYSVGNGCYELKLYGNPWLSISMSEGIMARKMLLEIIREFYIRRYRLYATADLKGTADCLFFIYQPEMDTTREKFCMVSLNANDRLRLIDCPPEVIDTTRHVVANYWPGGVQNENSLQLDRHRESPAFEFQMRGYPWWASGGDTVKSRLFLMHLFDFLLQRGWCVQAALDVTRRNNDKAVFVLRSCQPTNLRHFCISLNETDKIRLIGAPPEIVDLVRRTILNCWPRKMDNERCYFESLEFKLNGNPWSPFSTNDSCLARAMMCRILAALTQRGWRVITSADVSAKFHQTNNGPSYPIDVHSWFVVYTGISSPDGYDPSPPPSYAQIMNS